MQRRLPPLNSLKAFEAAARYCSFSDAAEELCVSHSAISHQIKQLEQYLNFELFTRKPHSVELTKAGKQLYPYLRDGFNSLAEGVELVLAPHTPSVLTVRIYNSLAIRWLIPRLSQFQALHPKIQVRLITSLEDVDFNHEDIDICVRTGKLDDTAVHYDHLFSSDLFPVCSPKLLRDGPPLTEPNDLAKHTILQVSTCENDWRHWLRANGVSSVNPDAGLVFDSYDLALTTAAQGLGVALALRPYASKDLALGVLVEPFPGLSVRYPDDWYLACRKDRVHAKKVIAFRDWIFELVKQDEAGQALA